MNATFIIAQLGMNCLLSWTALGQGSFRLQNLDPLYGIDAPVFDALGVRLAGPNYLVELWGSASTNSLTPALELSRGSTRLILPFIAEGYFASSAGFLSVPAQPLGGGGWAWLQVRAWDARLGATYEEVAGLAVGGYGESALFYAQGSNPFREPPEPPAPLIGLQSFSLRPVVPEPSAALLLLLALPWLFSHWRRKK